MERAAAAEGLDRRRLLAMLCQDRRQSAITLMFQFTNRENMILHLHREKEIRSHSAVSDSIANQCISKKIMVELLYSTG